MHTLAAVLRTDCGAQDPQGDKLGSYHRSPVRSNEMGAVVEMAKSGLSPDAGVPGDLD